MKTRRFLLFLSAALLPASASAQTVTWTGTVSGSWNEGGNWDSAAVPTSANDVVFNRTAATPVTLDADQVAASLSTTVTGSVNLTFTGGGTNRTLVVSGPTTVAGNGNTVIGSTNTNQNVGFTTTSISKSGTGNIELANANTIGDITVHQGRLFGRNGNAFGSATSGTITLGATAAANNIEFRLATGIYAAKPVVLGPTTGFIRIDTLGATSPTVSFPVTGTNNLQITSTNSSGPANMVYNTGPINHTGNLTLSNLGAGTSQNSRVTINALIGSNVGTVTATTSGTVAPTSFVRLTNPQNAWTGSTTINAGVNFQLGTSEVIPHGASAGDVVVNGALELATDTVSTTETINGFSGGSTGVIRNNGTAGVSTLVVGGNDGSGTYSGTFEQNASGLIALTKTGAGEIILAGPGPGYTGATRVLGGTLKITASDFLSTDGVVDVSSSGTLHLDYTGTTQVPALKFDGINAATGKWGRIGSIAALGAQFETSRIQGDGLIENLNTTGDLYWDGTGTSWDSAASWSFSASAASPDPVNPPNGGYQAIFGTSTLASPQNVTLGANQSVPAIRFVSNQLVTLTGNGSDRNLTVGAGGISVDALAKNPVIGSSTAGQNVNLLLDQSQIWNLDSIDGVFTVNNAVNAGGWDLTVTGGGSADFAGAVGGLVNLNLTGSGEVDFSGTLDASGIININRAGNLTLTGDISGSAEIIKKGSSLLTLSGANTFTSTPKLDAGTIAIAGDHSAATGGWLLRGYGATGTTFNNTATTLEIQSGASLTVAADKSIQAGNSSPSGGFTSQIINSAGAVTNNGTLLLGRAGTLNVTGGTWTQNGPMNVATQGGGLAKANVETGASLVHAHAGRMLLKTSTSTNTRTSLTINGGSVTTGTGFHNDTATAASGTSADLILGLGGTLKLSASIADLFTTAGASVRCLLNDGGGMIDTNGFSTTLNLPIEGNGGLVKQGTGTLTTTAANTYAGDTTVNGGTLELASAGLGDESAVTVAIGAKLSLNFTGEDTIASLTLGTTTLGAGTYDAISHPAFLSGSGKLTVVPVANTFASWAEGLGLSGSATDDFDSDGLDDAVEYVIGTDPKAVDTSGIQTSSTTESFIVTFNRDDRSETADLTLTVEAGSNLAAWPQSFTIADNTANSSPGVEIAENAGSPDTVTVTIPKNAATTLFARLKVAIATN